PNASKAPSARRHVIERERRFLVSCEVSDVFFMSSLDRTGERYVRDAARRAITSIVAKSSTNGKRHSRSGLHSGFRLRASGGTWAPHGLGRAQLTGGAVGIILIVVKLSKCDAN